MVFLVLNFGANVRKGRGVLSNQKIIAILHKLMHIFNKYAKKNSETKTFIIGMTVTPKISATNSRSLLQTPKPHPDVGLLHIISVAAFELTNLIPGFT